MQQNNEIIAQGKRERGKIIYLNADMLLIIRFVYYCITQHFIIH